jgi:hypothetical protein
MVGKLTNAHEKAFEQLLIVDTLRGQHSTGVAVVNNQNVTKIAKAVGHAFDLFDSRQYTGIYQGLNRVLIGHNRFATQGAVTKKNAHPFDFEGLVGAHNGTLSSKWKLHNSNAFQVDSEALYNHIEEKGLKDALNNMEGAWALTWYDKEQKTMNFLRNKERTLFLTTDDKGEVLFWASEAWMLSVILSRNNIKFETIEPLSENMHLSVGIDITTGKLDKPHVVAAPSTHTPIYNFPKQTQQTYTPPPLPGPPSDSQKKEDNFQTITGTVGPVEQDRNGGKFLPILVEEMGTRDIRWYYPHDINPLSMIGEEVEATMYRYAISDSKGIWFRVNPLTVKVIEQVEEGDEEGHGEFVCNCMWCQSPIHKGEPYAVSRDSFFTNEDRICKDCMNDPEIKEYITLISTGTA